MKIDYKSIVFNNINLKLIFNVALVAFSVYFFTFIISSKIYDYFSYRFENKYSYLMAIEYWKGNIQNPYSFYRTSMIYRDLNKFDKEKIELLYAKELLIISKSNSDLEKLVSSRLAELENF